MRPRNPHRRPGLAIALLLAGLLCGCGGGGSMGAAPMPMNPTPPMSNDPTSSAPPAVMQAQQANTPVDPTLVAADNTFGLNLFQKLNSGAAGNVAIAPISVAMALQIVYNGAGGVTQQGMAQTLQLGSLSMQDLNNDNAALQGSLMNPDPQVTLNIANSLWMHLATISVMPSFSQMDQMYYGATVGDLAGAPANVNDWVSTATNGLITSILPNMNYEGVAAVIANVIYFKGQWSTEFDPSQTAAAPFTLADGSQVSVQMMHQSADYGYFKGANFQAVRIPYGQGRLSMLAVMPDAGTSLSSFLAGVTSDAITAWEGQLQTGYGNLSLPRFTTTYGASLVPPLTALGMQDAFCSSQQAGFPGIGLVCLGDVEHKTVVEVDETGTVAAGATIVTVVPTAVQLPMFTVTLDHPFLYAIRDDKTGELLFIGTMMNPS
ncbi:MAG TPA: serpin family protein [Steroidobacteraceae bacterium]|nr:serpin family protein [Steroidobacteraceae bacterium]